MIKNIETLYHYCPTSAFISMISSKTIWLSSLTLSNDSNEGKVIQDTFNRILENDGFNADAHNQASAIFDSFEKTMDGLGFCLSSEGDLLSQWRGYAADGQGFSIGFSKSYLTKLSEEISPKPPKFNLVEVIYNPEQQETEVKPAYEIIKNAADKGMLKYPSPPGPYSGFDGQDHDTLYKLKTEKYKNTMLRIFFDVNSKLPNIFALKNPAFQEEKEWRLVTFLTKHTSSDCLIRSSGSRLIPYREFSLDDLSMPIINEIVIGPRNDTPEFVIEKLLSKSGFNNVPIRRSESTYR